MNKVLIWNDKIFIDDVTENCNMYFFEAEWMVGDEGL